jgi:hypothetical protein
MLQTLGAVFLAFTLVACQATQDASKIVTKASMGQGINNPALPNDIHVFPEEATMAEMIVLTIRSPRIQDIEAAGEIFLGDSACENPVFKDGQDDEDSEDGIGLGLICEFRFEEIESYLSGEREYPYLKIMGVELIGVPDFGQTFTIIPNYVSVVQKAITQFYLVYPVGLVSFKIVPQGEDASDYDWQDDSSASGNENGTFNLTTTQLTAPDYPGTYHLILKDADDNVTQATVQVLSSFQASFEKVVVGKNELVKISVSGGVPPYQYSIVEGQGEIKLSASPVTIKPTVTGFVKVLFQ